MDEFVVLLVDDETDYLEALMRRLKKRKVNVTGVDNGSEALRFLKAIPVDVVVLDVRMPEMDGIQVLRQIKKFNPLVEVIMLTGHANLEVAVEGMRLGAFDYLIKPAPIEELLYKIEDAYKTKTIQEKKIAHLEGEKSQRPLDNEVV